MIYDEKLLLSSIVLVVKNLAMPWAPHLPQHHNLYHFLDVPQLHVQLPSINAV
jgi:hypothetical protein